MERIGGKANILYNDYHCCFEKYSEGLNWTDAQGVSTGGQPGEAKQQNRCQLQKIALFCIYQVKQFVCLFSVQGF